MRKSDNRSLTRTQHPSNGPYYN